ncbi:MAG: TonB-dependent receptor, partial [Parvularculaceae bacterium]
MKRLLAAGASVVALAALTPGSAFAQSAVESLRDVITVTATKKANAEDVQDVPLAVTAYGDEQIEALKVRDLQSLTFAVPNVSLDDIGTSRGTANFSIRGVGINSSIPSIDPTVGVFVDGMYLGINAGVVFDIFDLESIEVLRGPQGILFGRNVTGGAVLLNTKKPGDEFEASFKGAVESGLRGTGLNYYSMGSISGPIMGDTLKAKVAVYYNKDEGWHKRFLGGPVPAAVASVALAPVLGPAVGIVGGPQPSEFRDFGEAETFLIRPVAVWTPSDAFELTVRFEHGESDGDGPAAQNHTNGSGVTNVFFSAPRDSFDFSIDNVGFYDNEWNQVVAEANWDVAFGDGTITNIFGWREYDSDTDGDIDATPLFLFHATTTTAQDQISNELRYAGRFFDRLDVTAGVYYFTQDIAYTERRFILGGARTFFGGGKQDQQTVGVFAQGDYDLTETITVTFGGRFTYEEKEADIANLLLNTSPCGVVEGTCPFDFSDRDDWSNFTPKVGVKWAPRDDFNLYGHWTQGIRSGGFNFRNTALASVPFLPNPAPPPDFVPNPNFDPLFLPGPFQEEKVNAFEVGFKAQPAEGRATINVAFYLNDIDDMQRELNLADP